MSFDMMVRALRNSWFRRIALSWVLFVFKCVKNNDNAPNVTTIPMMMLIISSISVMPY